MDDTTYYEGHLAYMPINDTMSRDDLILCIERLQHRMKKLHLSNGKLEESLETATGLDNIGRFTADAKKSLRNRGEGLTPPNYMRINYDDFDEEERRCLCALVYKEFCDVKARYIRSTDICDIGGLGSRSSITGGC